MLRKEALSLDFRVMAALLRGTLGSYVRVRLEGVEHLPKHAPCILAANHLSYLDPPLICAYLLPKVDCMISPAATKGLFRGPPGWVLRRMDAFVIDREHNRNLGAVRSILRRLKDQHPILIFPEGGIPKPEQRWQTKEGVGFIARRAGVPVIPVAVHNTNRALPDGKWLPRPHRVTIRVGPAVDLSGDTKPDEVSDHIMRAVKAEYDAIEAARGKA